MSDRKDTQEPSMEEILSSIRRIIADEQDEPAKRPAEPTPTAAAAEPEEDELELTELVAEPPAAPPPPPPPTAAVTPTRPPVQQPERPRMPAQDDGSLVSQTAAQASTSALARLTRAVAGDERPASGGGRSVEELVVELLRPQLKEWLDQNLAPLVERVVEQEVKKLARRAELM
jgi:hypothetical protein